MTRYDHSLRVSYYSYVLAKKIGLDYVLVSRAGLLHDFFFSEDDRTNIQNLINNDTTKLNSLTTQYNSLVDELNTLLVEAGVINYSPKYHISVSSSGDIIIYETHKGSYANGNTKYFKAGDIAGAIYKTRCDVLIKNLKKYF